MQEVKRIQKVIYYLQYQRFFMMSHHSHSYVSNLAKTKDYLLTYLQRSTSNSGVWADFEC